MPLKCGINLNINNLQGEITSKLSGFVDLSGTLGTPAGLATIKAQLNGAVTSIKVKFQVLIPEILFLIPAYASVFLSSSPVSANVCRDQYLENSLK